MAIFIVLILSSFTFVPIPTSSQNDEFTYIGFNDPKTSIITINGASHIHQNGLLQLTNVTSRLLGHAFFPSKLRFKNRTAFSFSTCFVFSILPEYPKLGGHGMAFAISPSKLLEAALPSQYLGLLSSSNNGNFSNRMFAVEFDTVQDFEFGDINDNHIGIDINSMVSNQSAAASFFGNDSVKNDLNLKSGMPVFAWIEYDSTTNSINVTLSPSSNKPRIPLLSARVDLSPILEEYMYVGFSASTGLLASSHYILGWSFRMNGAAKNLDLVSLPSLPASKKKPIGRIVALSTVAAAISILILVSLGIFLINTIRNAEVIESWELDVGPHRYKYHELKKATKGFKDSELLGFGGFGQVYRGTLPNPTTQVAVKRISHESKQGVPEFMSEISSIGRLRHRNLVQLLGWCRRGRELLLVYEFMPNGSLDKLLFGDPKRVLSWEQRLKIVKGIASGLLYLHEGYEQVVIHRDVKASNVLLDSEMNAKLGDFGLAKLYDHGSNPSTTRVVGTLGYLAPELSRTGRATARSDIFSFGILLLEIVCGRRPITSESGVDELVHLVDHVWSKWKEGRVVDVVDRRRMGDHNVQEVLMVLKLGLLCSSNEQAERPSTRQIVSYLEGEVEMPEISSVPASSSADIEKGFEDYVDSYAASYFEQSSTSALLANEMLHTSFATVSSSPSLGVAR